MQEAVTTNAFSVLLSANRDVNRESDVRDCTWVRQVVNCSCNGGCPIRIVSVEANGDWLPQGA